MDVKNAILGRRSIRKYKKTKINDKIILELIEAARLAPSGNNAQPSRFFIVKDDKIKDTLRKNKIFKQSFVYSAPLIIVCCTDPYAYTKKSANWDNENTIRALRDLAIASAFMVLRATELGLGTCYVGWIEKEKIKSVLNIPKKYTVPYVITVGYSAETPKPIKRKTIDKMVFPDKSA